MPRRVWFMGKLQEAPKRPDLVRWASKPEVGSSRRHMLLDASVVRLVALTPSSPLFPFPRSLRLSRRPAGSPPSHSAHRQPRCTFAPSTSPAPAKLQPQPQAPPFVNVDAAPTPLSLHLDLSSDSPHLHQATRRPVQNYPPPPSLASSLLSRLIPRCLELRGYHRVNLYWSRLSTLFLCRECPSLRPSFLIRLELTACQMCALANKVMFVFCYAPRLLSSDSRTGTAGKLILSIVTTLSYSYLAALSGGTTAAATRPCGYTALPGIRPMIAHRTSNVRCMSVHTMAMRGMGGFDSLRGTYGTMNKAQYDHDAAHIGGNRVFQQLHYALDISSWIRCASHCRLPVCE